MADSNPPDPRHKGGRLRLFPLIAATFFMVSGGPYGIEDTLGGAGYLGALLTGKQIRRGVHRSTRELEKAIRDYLDKYNENAKPFVWTKTADQILASVARFCQRTSVTGH